MDMIAVTSSNIAAVGYNAGDEILRVQFNNGRTYEYLNVEQDVYDNLMLATSIGKEFSATIKNQYPTQEV